ncbi:unnamed protein product [Paramecium pentaurelia]|uniref:Transmembrane protein n=1 Tax=Paramecium pentaurelia TaxID=43138 RepID=A0A8S1TF40_9CILI|nr:unnamed protein product [Paramecium pentaurelia]
MTNMLLIITMLLCPNLLKKDIQLLQKNLFNFYEEQFISFPSQPMQNYQILNFRLYFQRTTFQTFYWKYEKINYIQRVSILTNSQLKQKLQIKINK